MTRLFFALKIPEDIKKKIFKLIDKIIPNREEYKWEKEEKIHLTLKFIGEVEENKVEKISQSLDFIENYIKLQCKLSDFGFFYKRGIAKILWVSLSTDNSLYKLVDEINIALEQQSIPKEERKFKPHVTLLRMKNKESKDFINRFEKFQIPEIIFAADEVVLIKSDLLPDTSKYTVIKKYKLK